MNDGQKAWRAQVVVRKVSPHLAGEAPEVQSAVIADLLAMWLAGHPNYVREILLVSHLELVRALIDANERALFGDRGHPQNRHGN